MAKAKLKEEFHLQYTNNKTGALVNKYFSSESKLKEFLEEYSNKYTFLPQPRRIKNEGNVSRFEDSFQEAEEVTEGAHGRPAKEAIEIREKIRFRENLPMMGELEELEVFNENLYDGDLEQLIFDRKKKKSLVRLGFSSDRKQLFLVGGDQCLEDGFLRDCCPKGWEKDKVHVGFVYSITYWTDKHHLEGSSGKLEAYQHCFGEQTFPNPNAPQDGSADYMIWKLEEKLVRGVLPEIIYDRLNEQLELVGGGYSVRDEGIFD